MNEKRDRNELKKLIDSSGLKYSFIAKKLGIDQSSFWLKLKNGRAFREEEIESLCDILHIPGNKVSFYFFPKLSDKS